MNKYEFTGNTLNYDGITLRQIRALKDFSAADGIAVIAGQVGGYIEDEKNLSHDGACWIDETSYVYGYGVVKDDAQVRAESRVYDFAEVSGKAVIEYSQVYTHACITENASACESKIGYYAKVSGNARIVDSSIENATVCDNASVCDNSEIVGNVRMNGMAHIARGAKITCKPGKTFCLPSNAHVTGPAEINEASRCITFECTLDFSSSTICIYRAPDGEMYVDAMAYGKKHMHADKFLDFIQGIGTSDAVSGCKSIIDTAKIFI